MVVGWRAHSVLGLVTHKPGAGHAGLSVSLVTFHVASLVCQFAGSSVQFLAESLPWFLDTFLSGVEETTATVDTSKRVDHCLGHSKVACR